MGNTNFPYLHGFSQEEQDRLMKQARFAEFLVYKDVDLSWVENLIEVGCGVGAQTEILLRRFPNINITGIDLNDRQLATAKKNHDNNPLAKGRLNIQKMNAADMDFDSESFDGAFLCWILEHVPEPLRVLNEVRRVLEPGGIIYVTEVMNSSFFLDPYSPNLWKYWMAFNDFQYDNAGDPFVGAKLGNYLMQAGFKDVYTKVKTWHLDNRNPAKRKEIIDYWKDLLMSASEPLISSNYVSEEIVNEAQKELNSVSKDPNAVFYYSFMQARATV